MSATIDEVTVDDVTAVLETPSGALAVVKVSVGTILAADQNDILGKLKAEIDSFEPDISTEKGRKKIASVAAKVASAKMDLVRLANGLMEEDKKRIAAILGERKIIETKMDGLRDQVRAPLDAYQEAEKAREAAHEAALAEIVAMADAAGLTADQISARIWLVPALPDRDWGVFEARADRAIDTTIERLRAAHAAAVTREEEAVELARLRAEEAARIAADNERRRIEREEQIAADARAAAIMEAEAEADRVRVAAALALAEAEARAKRLVEDAEAARIKRHEDALEALDEDTNVIPGENSAQITATLNRFLARPARDWEEYLDRAGAALEAGERHLRGCLDFAVQREAKAAEKARVDEAARIGRQRQETIAAERRRVAAEAAAKQAEDDRRHADEAHRAQIVGEALVDIIAAMNPDFTGSNIEADLIGKNILAAMARGEIAHCRIDF